MIKGGGKSSSGYSADLMVCFPSRTQLSSLPSKSISSPSTSHSFTRRQTHRRSLSKLSTHRGEIVEEPTSPKVTCAGQIKVSKREGGGGSKNWESLMVEMEKIHRSKSESKFLGFKKDVMGLLSCLSDLSFDFRCFGAFDTVDVISDNEDEDEDEEDEEDEDEGSGTVFSKWFMVLHEDCNNENDKDNSPEELTGRQFELPSRRNLKMVSASSLEDLGPTTVNFLEKDDAETVVPPPNALLLMRCRSAPVKKAETEEDIEKQRGGRGGGEEREIMRVKKDLRSLMEEEKKMNLVVMNYDRDYYKLSSDIAKETWVVGGVQDPLFRSRSSKK